MGDVAGPAPARWRHLAIGVEASPLSEGEDALLARLGPAVRGAGPVGVVSVGRGVDEGVQGRAAPLRVIRECRGRTGGRTEGVRDLVECLETVSAWPLTLVST